MLNTEVPHPAERLPRSAGVSRGQPGSGWASGGGTGRDGRAERSVRFNRG